MLLQAYDYFHLNKEYQCELQLGGSDQWGNILSGIDLIRRLNNNKTYGITSPLITNNDGSKMGKTVDGAIWLAERKQLSSNKVLSLNLKRLREEPNNFVSNN